MSFNAFNIIRFLKRQSCHVKYTAKKSNQQIVEKKSFIKLVRACTPPLLFYGLSAFTTENNHSVSEVILFVKFSGAENQKRQALPLAMIQGGSLAINDKGSSLNNCTVFGNCTTQTAGANALVDPFTNNLFNGTMNHGAYQSMVHQVNSSVPLHNGTITVANKVAPLTEHDIQTMSSPHLPNTISVLKGTNIPERIKNKGTLVTIGNPSNAPIKPSRKSSFLPSNHTNVYFHVKGNAVAEGKQYLQYLVFFVEPSLNLVPPIIFPKDFRLLNKNIS